ncbi:MULTISPECIES: hypothetical protein [Photorhabdus]|uniref:Uncharacterized protein n=1 Tax=Photorhabdus luminescens TaxID=29488 RepID=A0A1G5R1E8_PHOLU|nr:hypothetical protein [Photorhabdus luminescens]SCZ67620.1 hypothetical protein SAMN02982990_02784 [Photorhabdus luminescens]
MLEDTNAVMEDSNVATNQMESSVNDLGLEVVEDIPQISVSRSVQPIR